MTAEPSAAELEEVAAAAVRKIPGIPRAYPQWHGRSLIAALAESGYVIARAAEAEVHADRDAEAGGEPCPAAPKPRELVAEYGQRLSSGGYETWNTAPHILRFFPLAERIAGEQRNGKVYRRLIIVVEDWAEVEAGAKA